MTAKIKTINDYDKVCRQAIDDLESARRSTSKQARLMTLGFVKSLVRRAEELA